MGISPTNMQEIYGNIWEFQPELCDFLRAKKPSKPYGGVYVSCSWGDGKLGGYTMFDNKNEMSKPTVLWG
jgi:hypothetical protein